MTVKVEDSWDNSKNVKHFTFTPTEIERDCLRATSNILKEVLDDIPAGTFKDDYDFFIRFLECIVDNDIIASKVEG